MDAADVDQDIILHRTAPDLLADFTRSLRPFLWKTTRLDNTVIRQRVRVSETWRLMNLLEPFQEEPQLLDPHLDKLVPILSNAFIVYLQSAHPNHPSDHKLLIPLSAAICKLLYTFCKIRGDKVIVRFWSTETRHLELLLAAIERCSPSEDGHTSGGSDLSEEQSGIGKQAPVTNWDWEERYITLLWLSQLLLAPFDLASISSNGTKVFRPRIILGLEWPEDVPGVTLRVVPLAIRYLSSSGKERDAAKVLLVRVAMRKDMQELGVLHMLVQWALFCLQPSLTELHSNYHHIGVLSFLAGILTASMSTADVDSYLSRIFQITQDINTISDPVFKSINTSAVARKVIIKIIRTIVVLYLRNPRTEVTNEIITNTIGHLLDALADPATPVRLAASKALSIIVLKLPQEEASQVVDAVEESLQKNMIWVKKPGTTRESLDLSRVNLLEWHGSMFTLSNLLYRRSVPATNLSPILNYLRLGLAFDQRSTTGAPIGTNVRDAACYGIWSMARRYSTQELETLKIESDVFTRGTPQDDVPALQIIATELVVAASLDTAGNIRRGASAALQELIGRHPDRIALGIKLVQEVDYHAVARRSRAVGEVGYNAAQLSGHYYQGLVKALLGWRGVQGADAKARRTDAEAIGHLVWSRYSINYSWGEFESITNLIWARLQELAPREAEERHGLLASLSCILKYYSSQFTGLSAISQLNFALTYVLHQWDSSRDMNLGGVYEFDSDQEKRQFYSVISGPLDCVRHVLALIDKNFKTFRQPGLVAEATSSLMMVSYSLLRADCVVRKLKPHRPNFEEVPAHLYPEEVRPRYLQIAEDPMIVEIPNRDLLCSPSFVGASSTFDALKALQDIQESYQMESGPDPAITHNMVSLIEKFLELKLEIPNESIEESMKRVDLVSDAAADLLLVVDQNTRSFLMDKWIRLASTTVKGGRTGQGKNYLSVIFKIFPISQNGDSIRDWQAEMLTAIRYRWESFHEIETRVTILKCLASSPALHTQTSFFIDIIAQGLDDYTTNARGDIGSLVRIEAAKTAGAIWKATSVKQEMNKGQLEAFDQLIGRIIRIAAEKLDKVRAEGQQALSYALCQFQTVVLLSQNQQVFQQLSVNGKGDYLRTLSSSSQEYFRFLLDMKTNDLIAHGPHVEQWRLDLLEGYVISADTGSENLVRASRAALVDFCDDNTAWWSSDMTNSEHISVTLVEVLKRNMMNDRVLVSCMEVLSFLLDMDIFQRSLVNFNDLCVLIQQAHLKSGNIRKLEAAVKIYGGMADRCRNALQKLTSMLLHPIPKIRNLAAEELWVQRGVGKSVDWTKAKRVDVQDLWAGLNTRWV